jgi:polyisoprenoid-binding protein YceI
METKEKTKWVIDPAHSEIHFKVRHLVISTVTGGFDKFEGVVYSSVEDFSDAEIEFSADVDSINTNQHDRDSHLKSPDFFDAVNHPKLTFRSTSIMKKGKSEYILKGNLTIKGTTKEIELSVEHGGKIKDPWGNIKAGFEITGKLNRKDYGLNWSAVTETGGLVAADEVRLQIAIELTKK